jgi:aspartate aminotransferase
MFSYTGLTVAQCERLTDEFHVYLLKSGRISMAGLNEGNINYFAEKIDKVVRES